MTINFYFNIMQIRLFPFMSLTENGVCKRRISIKWQTVFTFWTLCTIKYWENRNDLKAQSTTSTHTHLAHFQIIFKAIITHVCLEMTRLNHGGSHMYFHCGIQPFETTPTSMKKLLIPDVIHCNVTAITKIKVCQH